MRTLKLSLLLILAAIMTYSGEVPNGVTSCPTTGAAQVATGQGGMYQLTVTAGLSNTGLIYVGGSGVTSANGYPLNPGSGFTWSKPNAGVTPSSVYFACQNNTDSIVWIGNR